MTRWPAIVSAVVAATLAVVAGCHAPTPADGVVQCVEGGGSWAACGAAPPGMQPRAPSADYGTGYP